MSDSQPTFQENLPLVDELSGEEPDQVLNPPSQPTHSTEHSPQDSLTTTPPAETGSGPHSPFATQVTNSPAVLHQRPVEGEECPRHKLVSNLICLDPICASYRRFTCPECMIETHSDCQQQCTYDIERFAKAIKPDSAKLRLPYHRFRDLLGTKGLEFTLSGPVEAVLAAEDLALSSISWRDFRQSNALWLLELKPDAIHIHSVRLANLARLFEEVIFKLSTETVDEIFATTLVAFEKAIANELTIDPNSDLHPSLDDNIDVYSSSFSKKNYSDDSQVIEVEMDSEERHSFARTAGRGSHTRVFEEGSDIDEPRSRNAFDLDLLRPEKDRKKKEGRKTGASRTVRPKSVKPEVPSKPQSYLATPFKNSKVVSEADLPFLESLIPTDFQVQLVFSSDRDGLTDTDFHRLCDGIGPTLVLIQTDKTVVGGWTDKSWQSPDNPSYTRSSNAFLFSLTKKTKYPIKPDERGRATCLGKYLGPCFGDDIVISGLMDSEENSSRLGSVYSDLGVDKPFEELFGVSRFAVQRLEVYRCASTIIPPKLTLIEKAIADSSILIAEDAKFLTEILDEFTGFKLLFKSKAVEYTSQLFHSACDNQGPTLIVIKANGLVGGGFSGVSWESTGGYKRSERAFIYSLSKKMVFPVKPGNANSAVFMKADDGPNFGDRDLYISKTLSENTNRTNLGSYFDSNSTENSKKFLFEAENFPIEEYEVFAVEM